MIVRLSKSLIVLAVALFATLVVFGNVTDYETNFTFIHHVFSMDTIFPGSTIKYRAITSTTLQKIAYAFIILLEAAAALFCWVGGFRLLANLKQEAHIFNKKKNAAIIGLTIGFFTWQLVLCL